MISGRDYVTPEDVKAVAHAGARPPRHGAARAVDQRRHRRQRRRARSSRGADPAPTEGERRTGYERRDRPLARRARAEATRAPRPPADGSSRRRAPVGPVAADAGAAARVVVGLLLLGVGASCADPTPSPSARPSPSSPSGRACAARRPHRSCTPGCGTPSCGRARRPRGPRPSSPARASRTSGSRCTETEFTRSTPTSQSRRRRRRRPRRRPSLDVACQSTRWGLRRLGPATCAVSGAFGAPRWEPGPVRGTARADRPAARGRSRRAGPPRDPDGLVGPQPLPPPRRRQRARRRARLPLRRPAAPDPLAGVGAHRRAARDDDLRRPGQRGPPARRRHARPRPQQRLRGRRQQPRQRRARRGGHRRALPARRRPGRASRCSAPAEPAACHRGVGQQPAAPHPRRARPGSGSPTAASSTRSGCAASCSTPSLRARSSSSSPPRSRVQVLAHAAQLARRGTSTIVVDTLPRTMATGDLTDEQLAGSSPGADRLGLGPARLAAAAARARPRGGADPAQRCAHRPVVGPGTLDLVLRDIARQRRSPRVVTR